MKFNKKKKVLQNASGVGKELSRKKLRRALKKEKKVKTALHYARIKNTNKVCVSSEDLQHFKYLSNQDFISTLKQKVPENEVISTPKNGNQKRNKNKAKKKKLNNKSNSLIENETNCTSFKMSENMNVRLAKLQEYVDKEKKLQQNGRAKSINKSTMPSKTDTLIRDKCKLESLREGQIADDRIFNHYARNLMMNAARRKRTFASINNEFDGLLGDIETGTYINASKYSIDKKVDSDNEDKFEDDLNYALGKKDDKKSKGGSKGGYKEKLSNQEPSNKNLMNGTEEENGLQDEDESGDGRSESEEQEIRSEDKEQEIGSQDEELWSENEKDFLDDEAEEDSQYDDECSPVPADDPSELMFEGGSCINNKSAKKVTFNLPSTNSIFSLYETDSEEENETDLEGFVVGNDVVEYESDCSDQILEDENESPKENDTTKESLFFSPVNCRKRILSDSGEEDSCLKSREISHTQKVKKKKETDSLTMNDTKVNVDSKVKKKKTKKKIKANALNEESTYANKCTLDTQSLKSNTTHTHKKCSGTVDSVVEKKRSIKRFNENSTHANGHSMTVNDEFIDKNELCLKSLENDTGDVDSPLEKKKKIKQKRINIKNLLSTELDIVDKTGNSNDEQEFYEDIYGRKKIKRGNKIQDGEPHTTQYSKYIPPALRKLGEKNENVSASLKPCQKFSKETNKDSLISSEVNSDKHLNSNTEFYEDIYGKKRNKLGDIIGDEETCTTRDSKYMPPAMRKLMTLNNSEKRREHLSFLERKLKGFLNRLAGNTMASIINQIEALFENNSRNDINDILTKLYFQILISPTLTSERFLQEHALVIAVLSIDIGPEVGAYILTEFVVRLVEEREVLESNAIECKILDNLLHFICQLYNFKVVDSTLIYDIIHKMVEKTLGAKEIDLILLALRTIGFSLRKDNPFALKDFISSVQIKANDSALAESDQSYSRVKFMLEILIAIRNNNVNKVPNYDPSHSQHLKGMMKGLIRKSGSPANLKVSLEDLLKSKEVGKWWLVGSAWSGCVERDSKQNSDSVAPSVPSVPQISYSDEFMKKAAKLHMSRPPRINILYVTSEGAEDCIDSFEKLLALKLSASQEQEIFNVVLYCCVRCKEYKSFYAQLCVKLCNFKKSFPRLLEFSLWDQYKELSNMKKRRVSNLARFVGHIIGEGGLYLTAYKGLNFAGMDDNSVSFLRQSVISLLLHPTGTYGLIKPFQSLCSIPGLKYFRQYLRVFIVKFIDSKKCEQAEAKLLDSRIKMVLDILTSQDGIKL